MEKMIRFHGMDSVQEFVRKATDIPEYLELHSGDIVVDAKSMMGVFSLDLRKPIRLRFEAEKSRSREICKILRNFITEQGE